MNSILTPHQVVLGAANPYINAFSHAKYLGRALLAYASDNLVTIYSGTNYIQTLGGHNDEITCVSWCHSIGKLVSCSKNRVIIFEPEDVHTEPSKEAPSIKLHWRVSEVLETPNACIEAASWNLIGTRLLLAGKSTLLFELDNMCTIKKWRQTWSQINPNPIQQILFSPDERLFVTVAKNDPIVKIWFRTELDDDKENFSFLYLSHLRGVTQVDWRPKKRNQVFVPNVLMTVSKDNIMRLWTETYKSEELYFYVTFSEKFESAHYEWLKEPIDLNTNEVIDYESCFKKYIEGGHDDITKENLEEQTFGALQKTMDETQTWLSKLESNGSLTISIITGLGEFPRRTPKSITWLKIDKAFLGIGSPTKMNFLLKSKLLTMDSPVRMSIYVSNEHGAIANYTLDIVDRKTDIQLAYVYTGHRNEVSMIVSHRNLPLVASYEKKTQTLIIWHKKDTDYFSPVNILTNVQDYYNVKSSDMAWSQFDPILFLSTPNGIEMFSIQQQRSNEQYVTTILNYEEKSKVFLEESDDFTSVLFIKMLPLIFNKESPFHNNSIIVAVTAECFGIWRIWQQDGKYESRRLTKFDFDTQALAADCRPFVVMNGNGEDDERLCKMFLVAIGNESCVKIHKCTIQDQEPIKFSLTSKSKGPITIEKYAQLETDHPVRFMQLSDYLSHIALYDEKSNSVKIFECATSPSWVLEQAIPLENQEKVTCLKWMSLGDGQAILVFSTTQRTLCYTGGKITEKKNSKHWKALGQLGCENQKSGASTFVCVTKEKTIITCIGKSLHVYTKWCVNQQHESWSMKSLIHHRRLPDYHPRFLIDLLMHGSYDLVKKILIRLADALKDTENDINYQPLDPRDFLQEDTSIQAPVKKGLLDRFTSSESTERFEAPTVKFGDSYKLLTQKLAKHSLPDLGREELMQLVALVDTFHTIQERPGALDDSGTRFLISFRLYQNQKNSSSDVVFKNCYYAWAMQSETQDAIFDMIAPQKLTFGFFKEAGFVFWAKRPLLIKVVEQMAKDIFSVTQEPSSVSIYYIALKKKNALSKLFKAKGNEKASDFLNKDFTDHKNQVASGRVAMDLISRHKAEEGASFYLLSDSLKDCLDVILNRKNEPVLGLTIARLYAGENDPIIKKVYDSHFVGNDEWMNSIAKWNCGEYEESLECLIQQDVETPSFDPSIYSYLKHCVSLPKLKGSELLEQVRESLLLQISHFYSKTGSYYYAIIYLIKLNQVEKTSLKHLNNNSNNIFTGQFDMGSFGGSFGFGFNQPVVQQVEVKKRKVIPSIKDKEELLKMTSFTNVLKVLTQQLYDFEMPKYTSDAWSDAQKRMMEWIQFMVDKVSIPKNILDKMLMEFCDVNGLLLCHALMHPDTSLTDILDIESQQIVTLLAVMIEQPLDATQALAIDKFAREFYICYSRCMDCKVELSESKSMDYKVVYFISLFIMYWSRRDFGALLSLLQVAQGGLATALADLNAFQEKLNTITKQNFEDEEAEISLSHGSTASTSSNGTELKDEHNWEIYNALLVFHFGKLIKDYLEKGYNVKKISSLANLDTMKINQEYSPLAQAIIYCIALWFDYHHKKLEYKEMEVVAKEIRKQTFRDISFKQNVDHMVNTLKKKHSSTILSFNKKKERNFATLMKAIPEIGLQQIKSNFEVSLNSIKEATVKVETFKPYYACQRLWKYLVEQKSCEEFFSIGTEIESKILTPESCLTEEIEIVKSRDKVRSFCIDPSNPVYMAFATKKGIREINIDHSIRFRSRNDSLDKLMDEEGNNWEESLHRFDEKAKDAMFPIYKQQTHVIPTSRSFDFSDFLTRIKMESETKLDKLKLQGLGSEPTTPTGTGMKKSPSQQNLAQTKRVGSQGPPAIDHSNISVSQLMAHPYLPMYVSGGMDGSVCLWQFGQSAPLRVYKCKTTRITCIQFTTYGHKFGVSDKSGNIHLYKFDPLQTSTAPFITVHAHAHTCSAFAFIDSGSLIASIGTSMNGHSLKMWDLLLPDNEMNVLEVALEFIPTRLVYSSRNQYLVIGGRKGELGIFDMKQKKMMRVMHEHSDKISGLCLDRSEEILITSSYDKTLKVWNLKTLDKIEEHSDLQMTHCDWAGEFVYCATKTGLVTRRRYLQ